MPGLDPDEVDPVPAGVFLDHAEWFAGRKGIVTDPRMVTGLSKPDDTFEAVLEDGDTVVADKVLAAPGLAPFANLPEWSCAVPADRRGHTSEVVDFGALAGARVVVVGGRQSAYEWAALLCDHGAESVDVVHRHDVPGFARVDWSFVDEYVERTLAVRGWWRRLPPVDQQAVGLRFWEAGRLTLAPWLVPRLDPAVVRRHPWTAVVDVTPAGDGSLELTLADGTRLEADHVVFATGYRAELARVPHLAGVLDRVSVTDGCPDLSEGFETTLPGLFVTGFAAVRSFGPFYAFTKGCPSASRIAVEEMLRD